MTDQYPASELLSPPSGPFSAQLDRAQMVLLHAHIISRSFLIAFERFVASDAGIAGNQIRAMLVFVSAGLDSMVKHLIEDALPIVIKRDTKARERLREFVENRIQREEQPNYRILSDLLIAESPIDEMIGLLVEHLTANSLQSVEEMLRVASYFNIESNAITSDANDLRRIFRIRNEIIHEMDIDSSQTPTDFRPRNRESMVEATNQLLTAAAAFLAAVDAKLT